MSKTTDYTPLQMAGFLLGYIAGSDEPDALLVARWLRDWQATPASSRFLDLDAPAEDPPHIVTLYALRDNLVEPYRGVLQAVIDLVAIPGPSNNLSWAFVAVDEHAVTAWLDAPETVERLARACESIAAGANPWSVAAAILDGLRKP